MGKFNDEDVQPLGSIRARLRKAKQYNSHA